MEQILPEGLSLSTDKSKLDLELIYHFLSQESYWAQGRSLATVEKSIRHSLCFGLFDQGQQIGFARVVSDFAVFAWLMDVFILPEYRGRGLGKYLIDAIMNHPDLQNLQRWGLNTWDAHSLYEQYGFSPLEKPEVSMEQVRKPS